jgi:hypothetical protein
MDLSGVNPVAVSLIALTVAIVTLLFGNSIVTRVGKWISDRARERKTSREKVLSYLKTACVFVDGLPLFIENTWDWGPSVPNYAAGGSFPDQSVPVEEMEGLGSIVGEAVQLYCRHSKSQGKPFAVLDEAKGRLDDIQQRFWNALESFVESYWPADYPVVIRELRRHRIPDSERERILAFQDRSHRSGLGKHDVR